MFGYIKINKEELLVREYALYRAVYCGLCKEIKRKISFFLPFSLSYDFVFLAIARDMLEENDIKINKGRCPYNLFKKRAFVSSSGIEFAAKAALVLVEKNVEDKRCDKDAGLLSPLLWPVQKYLVRKIKKHLCDGTFQEMLERVNFTLDDFSQLEKEKASTDALYTAFGQVLGETVSAGLEGDKKRIATSLGQSLGGWLYLADAVDDMEKDFEKKNFNPLIKEYGTPDKARERFKTIDIAFGALARDAHLALSLLPNHAFSGIANNILASGLGLEAYRIMNNDRRKK